MAVVTIGLIALIETDPLMSVSMESLDVNQQEVQVKMRDGIQLAADLYLPAAEGPFPTLVRKTPYTRERRSEMAELFAANGYAVLVVSQRSAPIR